MNERTEKELKKLIETINNEIRANIESINNYIEFCCARVLKEGIKLYEHVHDWDPYYDHSGRLVETGIYITPDNCELTVEEFWELHTGNSWASYVSGCGLFYECYDKIFEEALRHSTTTIQNNVIMQAVQKHKLDSVLQEQEIDDLEEDEIIEALWEELDGETFVDNEYEITDDIPIYHNREHILLIDLYKKHQFLVERVCMGEEKYRNAHMQYMDELRKEAETIKLKSVFHGKVKVTKKNTEFLEQLKESYSERELALLVYFGKIMASNSLEGLFTRPLIQEMNNKRRELEEQYCVNVDFEPQFYSV